MTHELSKWDKRFLHLASVYASWSKDPSTKVGAVIVNDKNQQVGQGYNGFPRNMYDLLDRYGNRDFKYKFILHAEENAILNAQGSLEGSTMYLYPFLCCTNCASKIIQTGIKKIVAPASTCERWGGNHAQALTLLEETGIEVVEVTFDNINTG